MGYREDVVIVFSSDGWIQLGEAINKAGQEAEVVRELINACDGARVTFDGDRLIKFDCVKVYADDFRAFMDCISNVHESQYLGLFLGEDGAENFQGDYWDNPFFIGVSRRIEYECAGTDWTGDDMFAGMNTPAKNAPTIPAPVACMDDHTCMACGNTKCSKTEKSCWKCGHPI